MRGPWAAFGFGGQVNSVKQVLSLLGEDAVRKWATLIAIGELGEDRPQELLITCMVRARLCEILAPAAGLGHHARDLFLVGLLTEQAEDLGGSILVVSIALAAGGLMLLAVPETRHRELEDISDDPPVPR